jgi:hypothetical protein
MASLVCELLLLLLMLLLWQNIRYAPRSRSISSGDGGLYKKMMVGYILNKCRVITCACIAAPL